MAELSLEQYLDNILNQERDGTVIDWKGTCLTKLAPLFIDLRTAHLALREELEALKAEHTPVESQPDL